MDVYAPGTKQGSVSLTKSVILAQEMIKRAFLEIGIEPTAMEWIQKTLEWYGDFEGRIIVNTKRNSEELFHLTGNKKYVKLNAIVKWRAVEADEDEVGTIKARAWLVRNDLFSSQEKENNYTVWRPYEVELKTDWGKIKLRFTDFTLDGSVQQISMGLRSS